MLISLIFGNNKNFHLSTITGRLLVNYIVYEYLQEGGYQYSILEDFEGLVKIKVKKNGSNIELVKVLIHWFRGPTGSIGGLTKI